MPSQYEGFDQYTHAHAEPVRWLREGWCDYLVPELYWKTAKMLPWHAGDIMMLDNMLTAHARMPFTGPRKIVVAMGEMLAARDLA